MANQAGLVDVLELLGFYGRISALVDTQSITYDVIHRSNNLSGPRGVYCCYFPKDGMSCSTDIAFEFIDFCHHDWPEPEPEPRCVHFAAQDGDVNFVTCEPWDGLLVGDNEPASVRCNTLSISLGPALISLGDVSNQVATSTSVKRCSTKSATAPSQA